ncbi:MAG: hypothetical protein WKF86_03075 [Acidimicrobiales bacterium]
MVNDEVERQRGAGLVSVVIVIMILGGLAGVAAYGMTRVAKDPLDASPGAGLTPADRALLAGKAPPEGSASLAPRRPTDGASTAACLANVRVIEEAASAKFAIDGSFPATLAELVSDRWLAEVPDLKGYELTMEAAEGRPNGKVLVNGLPSTEGCAAPPRPGP